MAYTKLFGSIVHSTIWREPNETRLVWITMLALADRDGIVEASIPGLADAARVGISDVERALSTFMSPDKYSRSQAHEGRRIEVCPGGWRLLNHDVYRHKASVEERQRKERERKRRYRDRCGQSRGHGTFPSSPCIAEAKATPEAKASQETIPTSTVVAKDPTGQSEQRTDDDGGRETVCPADLERRAVSLGIVRDFAEHYRQSSESVLASVREFCAYWTIGGGSGKRKRNWPQALRQRLKEVGEQNKFPAPGAVDHEDRKAHEDAEHTRWLMDSARAGDFGLKAQRMAEAGDTDGLKRAWERIRRRNAARAAAQEPAALTSLAQALPAGTGAGR